MRVRPLDRQVTFSKVKEEEGLDSRMFILGPWYLCCWTMKNELRLGDFEKGKKNFFVVVVVQKCTQGHTMKEGDMYLLVSESKDSFRASVEFGFSFSVSETHSRDFVTCAWDVSQWQSACRTCTRSWTPSLPLLDKQKQSLCKKKVLLRCCPCLPSCDVP